MNIKNNLILALDVGSEKEAIDICEKVSQNIDTIKIGYPLALAEGLEIINKLKDKFDFKVICDFKVADIDATNEKICEETFKAGADAISLINTLVGMRRNLKTGEPIIAVKKGGYSGPGIFPVALRMVYEVSHAVDIPIIGMYPSAPAYFSLAIILAITFLFHETFFSQ